MKITSFVIGIALGVCVSVQAQVTKPTPTALNGGTNNVAAATTNVYSGITMGVQDFQYVGLQVSYSGDSGCTGNSTLSIAQSADGTTYEDVPSITCTLTNQGTTAKTFFTNLFVPGTYNLKVVSWGNTNAAHYNTNISVKFYPKQYRVNNHN